MRTLSCIATLPFVLSCPAFAVDTVETCYVDGIAPITIDGDLSDWEGLDLPGAPQKTHGHMMSPCVL